MATTLRLAAAQADVTSGKINDEDIAALASSLRVSLVIKESAAKSHGHVHDDESDEDYDIEEAHLHISGDESDEARPERKEPERKERERKEPERKERERKESSNEGIAEKTKKMAKTVWNSIRSAAKSIRIAPKYEGPEYDTEDKNNSEDEGYYTAEEDGPKLRPPKSKSISPKKKYQVHFSIKSSLKMEEVKSIVEQLNRVFLAGCPFELVYSKSAQPVEDASLKRMTRASSRASLDTPEKVNELILNYFYTELANKVARVQKDTNAKNILDAFRRGDFLLLDSLLGTPADYASNDEAKAAAGTLLYFHLPTHPLPKDFSDYYQRSMPYTQFKVLLIAISNCEDEADVRKNIMSEYDLRFVEVKGNRPIPKSGVMNKPFITVLKVPIPNLSDSAIVKNLTSLGENVKYQQAVVVMGRKFE